MRKLLLLINIFILTGLFSCNKKVENRTKEDEFVNSLLKQLTLEEKIGQLTLFTSGWDVTGPTLRENYRDDVIGGKCGNIFNAHTVEYNTKLQKLASEESRMGIPLLFGYDVIHGHKTIFPIPIGEACSWDSVLIEKSARLSAKEAAASGICWTFSPVVDISRDPRWGRVSEGIGEDVLLGNIYARAKVRGYQGEDLSDSSTVAACVKHYAGYGAPQGGRDYNTVDMSERVFMSDYFPPYEAAVEAGASSVMTAFNEIFGVPSSGSEYLLKNLLRDKLEFDGVIVTDYTSITEMVQHGYAENEKHSAELAFTAGVDMDMQSASYYNYLEQLMEEGKISIEEIDNSVKRVLRMKYQLGLFDDPYKYLDPEKEKEVVFSKELFEHALYAGERSIVLLKNDEYKDKKLLPLNQEYKKIALIGPLANNRVDILGSWHASGANNDVETLGEAFAKNMPDVAITVNNACGFYGVDKSGFQSAIEDAKKSDLVILAIGENYVQSGEAASRTDIGLPGVQEDLAKEIVKTGKPVIAVVFAGRPLTINWLQVNIPSIVYAWQPGTMAAQAVYNILSGKYNPSAKLTMTFPRNVGQIPLYYNMKNTGRPFEGDYKYQSKYIDSPNSPLYPFGFGLSYTSFEYSALELSDTVIHADQSLEISITVKNSGTYKGEEIVQLYIRDMVASVTQPVLQLKKFKKILLAPGESKKISFIIKEEDLRFINNKLENISEPGEFEVHVGPNSVNLITGKFRLIGR